MATPAHRLPLIAKSGFEFRGPGLQGRHTCCFDVPPKLHISTNTEPMSHYMTPENKRQLVKVIGREDVGEIVHGGHNFGSVSPVYCVGVHFPSDGFCGYYDKTKVTYLDASGN